MSSAAVNAPMSSEAAAEYLTATYGVPFMWADLPKICRYGIGPAFTSYNRQLWFKKCDLDFWAQKSIKRSTGAFGPAPEGWKRAQAHSSEMDVLAHFSDSYEEASRGLEDAAQQTNEDAEKRNNVLDFNDARTELYTFRCSARTKKLITEEAQMRGVSVAELMDDLVQSTKAPRNLRGGDDVRSKQFNFRCTPEVHRAIHWLARKSGLSAADLIEELVLCEAEQQEPASA